MLIPLLNLLRAPPIRNITRLVEPSVLILLPCPPLLVVNRLVLPIVPLTLLPDTPAEEATATPRLPFAFKLPVDMPMTLPVLTLKAILTRGTFSGVGVTLLSSNTLRDPPLPVNLSLFRKTPTLIVDRPLVVAEKTRSPPAGTAAPSLTTSA